MKVMKVMELTKMKTKMELPMPRAIAGLVLLAALVAPAAAEESAGEHEMMTYQLVLVHRGPDRTPIGERGIQRLQEEHLAYLDALRKQGKLLVEGPVDGGGDLRSVIVLDVGSTEEAEAVMAADAWVRAGKRRAEIHSWWAARGILRRPERLDHNARAWIGLLERPADAPSYPVEKLAEIQAGHLENIGRMAEAGDLVLAGPLGDDGALRGIFVFRNVAPERIVEQFRQDPANQAGRLSLRLYPWHIPAGTLP